MNDMGKAELAPVSAAQTGSGILLIHDLHSRNMNACISRVRRVFRSFSRTWKLDGGRVGTRLLAAIVLGLASSAQAQLNDHLAGLRSLPALRFPETPVESAAGTIPEMAMYKPAGPGPFAAMILHHGCAGVRDHIGDWTNELVKAGYLVLVLDSLSQRSISTNCVLPNPIQAIEGALDAYRALEHLAGQPYVDKNRIGMLGFSWGGMTALLAARREIAEGLPRSRKELRFRALVAMYPYCFWPSAPTPRGRMDLEFLGSDTERPLLVLMGENDEDTPPKFCLPRLEALKAKGANVDWQVFPKATHLWDSKQSHGRRGQAFFEYSAETTLASNKRILEFLNRELRAGDAGAKPSG